MIHNVEYKRASSKDEFLNNTNPYALNMLSNKKMLHKKGCKSCPSSHFLQLYVDFASIEEAETFPLEFSKCQKCFPIQRK